MIRLKEARIAAGMTQQELSAISGVPQNTISTLESGKRTNPGIDTLIPLALALGKKVDDLLLYDEKKDGAAS